MCEESGEIGLVFKSEFISQLVDGEICVRQSTFGLQHDFVSDVSGSAHTGHLLYHFVEVDCGDAQSRGIEGWLVAGV